MCFLLFSDMVWTELRLLDKAACKVEARDVEASTMASVLEMTGIL